MDNMTKSLVRYEWKAFVRNKFQVFLIAITLLFSFYAIYYGQSEIEAQKRTIRAVKELESTEFSGYKASFKEELESLEQERNHDIASNPAYAWYRQGYHAILVPHDYAALAIGQRDLFRFYYRLTGMSLHYQLFENELANPVNLMAGNFDLSFVLVYLFPLLIIAFCYGLYSTEHESGRLSLLQIQTVSIRKITLIRLIFYFVMITGLALLISLVGLMATGDMSKSENLAPAILWVIAVLIYSSFWFGLMFLIVSLRRSSAFNAITGAGLWLIFLIVIPAVLNVAVTIKYPLDSTSLAGLTRRTGLENENDEEETRGVIMEFLAHRPQLAGSDSLIHNNLLPKAYAAFTTLKDIHGQDQVDYYNAQVKNRSEWTSRFYWLSPAVSMQEILAHIVETDLNTFLHFQDALVIFHGEITSFYFTRLFWDKPILLEDYSRLPVFQMPEIQGRWTTIWLGIAKMYLMAVVVFVLGFYNMRGR